MDKAKIEFEIQQLTELQSICKQISDIESFKQNNDSLIDVLKKEYKLTAEETSTITSLVEGKRKKAKKDKESKTDDIETLKKKFTSYCTLLDLNPNNKSGEFLGYTNVGNKCSNKKSILKKKINQSEE